MKHLPVIVGKLRFSKFGNKNVEKSYETHFV